MERIATEITELEIPQPTSLAVFFLSSGLEIRLYRMLNRSRIWRIQILPIEGISIIIAITAPRLKSRYSTQHLVVQQGCNYLIPSADRCWNSKISKAQKECLDKCTRQSSQKWSENGNPEG